MIPWQIQRISSFLDFDALSMRHDKDYKKKSHKSYETTILGMLSDRSVSVVSLLHPDDKSI